MRRSLLLTFLLLLAASTASAQKLQAVKRLMVVDASGKKVGDVLPSAAVTGNGAYVAFRINGNLVPLFVRKFGIEGHGGDVYFPSDDCLGAPFMIEQGAFAPLVTTSTGSASGNPQGRRTGEKPGSSCKRGLGNWRRGGMSVRLRTG